MLLSYFKIQWLLKLTDKFHHNTRKPTEKRKDGEEQLRQEKKGDIMTLNRRKAGSRTTPTK